MITHLSVRSCYTLLNSTIRIDQIVEKAKEFGMSSVALSDHNVMHGAAAFSRACRKNGIHPIYGLEADCSYHDEIVPFLLLAKDNIGFRNLIRLSSCIMSGKECCTTEELVRYSEHCFLIVYGEGGWFESEMISEKKEMIAEKLLIMKNELPEFDVAVSYMDASMWRIKNAVLKQVCRSLRIRTVALNKIYYLKKDESDIYRIVTAIRRQTTLNDQTLQKISGRYFLSPQEMEAIYDKEDLERTEQIAAECRADMALPQTTLPAFKVPDGITSEQYLTQLCIAGLKKRLKGVSSNEYLQRLKYELSVIVKMHFEDYFLIVYDFIRYARQHGIYIGPGRGSAAGSLVAYCLGITQIDPLKYNLLFERFLNTERVSMPDIDTDIPDNRRQEVIDYVCSVYGSEHVANICTFGTLAAKQVIRDVGKVMNIPLRDVEMITRNIPAGAKVTLESAFSSNPKLREIIRGDRRYQELFQAAKVLEGLPRHVSTHAAGIAMSRLPLNDVVPTMQLNEGISTSQYTMEYLEERGLIKMDFLGLRNLTIIDEIVQRIRETDPSFSIMNIPLENDRAYEVFESCDTTGIFQFESEGMRALLRQMRPKKFSDVVAALSLFRPASADQIPTYLNSRMHPEQVQYPAEALKNILEETYGVMIYQEQAMLTSQIIAGFSLGKADILRKAMSKKNTAELANLKDDFINGSIRNGYSRETAEKLFDLVDKFGGYGFNKSHAVAYGLIAYQMAYLKANAPYQFYIALLNSVIGDETKTSQYIDECRRRGIEVTYPDVNRSVNAYQFMDGKIYLPLAAVKGVGYHAGAIIIEERAKGAYQDFFDFIARATILKVNRKTLEALIKGGALDGFGYNRTTLLNSLDDAINYSDLVRIEQDGQIRIDLGLVSKPVITRRKDSAEEISENERLALGFCLGPHPILEVKKRLNINAVTLSSFRGLTGNVNSFAMVEAVREHRTKRGELMAFVQIADETDRITLLVMPKLFTKLKAQLQKGTYIQFRGKIQEDGSCIADNAAVVAK